MSVDRLSNMLSAIKNAVLARNSYVEIVHTNECEAVLKVMKDKGFVKDVKVFKPNETKVKMLHIDLKDETGNFNIKDLKRISKPGNRVYKKSTDIKLSRDGFGLFIVSTSRGIIDGQSASKKRLGGEVICEVY